MNYWDICTHQDFRQFAGPDMVSDSRDEGGGAESPGEGMATITLRNWRLLEPLLYTMVEMSHAIFRGVECSSFALTPSIFRRFAFLHMLTTEEKNTYIDRCYNHFLQAIRGRRGPLSKPLDSYSRFEIWSLGRHYGVSNTMLDWSHSPYVCLFFAFADRDRDDMRSLYCLKQNVIEAAREKKPAIKPGFEGSRYGEDDDILLTDAPEYDSLRFYRPLSDDNFRMINQQGVFTVSRSPHSIEKWVSHNYPRVRDHLHRTLERETSPRGREKLLTEIKSGWILLKVNIETSEKDRAQILRTLNRMNINYASLFPDVEGASLYANMQGDIHHY